MPPREPREPTVDEGISDWRNAPRKGPLPTREGRFGERKSPQSSTPPTPAASRRKLELLPRGNNSPSSPSSPLTSPPPTSATLPHVKSNPFGDAKPIDVSAREKEIEEKLAHKPVPVPAEKPERPARAPAAVPTPAEPSASPPQPAHPSAAPDTWRRRGPPSERATPSHSRQPSSGPASSRGASRTGTPPTQSPKTASTPAAEGPAARAAANVRPTFSFAAAAATISIDEEGPPEGGANALDAKESGHANGTTAGEDNVDSVAAKVSNMTTADSRENAVKDAINDAAANGGVQAQDDGVKEIAEKIVDEA